MCQIEVKTPNILILWQPLTDNFNVEKYILHMNREFKVMLQVNEKEISSASTSNTFVWDKQFYFESNVHLH